VANQPGQLSPDGLHYWNNSAWHPTTAPDGRTRWNGSSWMPIVGAIKKGHKGRNIALVIGGLMVLGIGGVIASSASQSPTASKPAVQGHATAIAQQAAQPTAAPKAPPASTLTNQQQNAAKSARQYLSFTGFSRLGLIDQLSSSAGEGYPGQDATIAVDSLNVDWNAEAVQSAKAYLKISPFSCNGLIEQLSSSAGEKFTVEQATYGAQQAGAC
jgi:hypothetical protein